MDPNILLVAAVILILGWFAFGVIFNLRRGDAILRWLQKGLPRAGERTTFRWLGTSVVELSIEKAKAPFKRLDTLIVLAPRDVPWLWLLAASQGRRDTLIFRVTLLTTPKTVFALADPTSWIGRMALKQAAQQGWVVCENAGEPAGYRLMAPAGAEVSAAALAPLLSAMRALSPRFFRLSLRKETPQLEVHVPFPDRSRDAGAYIGALQELAKAAG